MEKASKTTGSRALCTTKNKEEEREREERTSHDRSIDGVVCINRRIMPTSWIEL